MIAKETVNSCLTEIVEHDVDVEKRASTIKVEMNSVALILNIIEINSSTQSDNVVDPHIILPNMGVNFVVLCPANALR